MCEQARARGRLWLPQVQFWLSRTQYCVARPSESVDLRLMNCVDDHKARQTRTDRHAPPSEQTMIATTTAGTPCRPGDLQPTNLGRSEQLPEPKPSRPWPTVGLLRAMWTSSLRNVTSSSHRRRLSPAWNVYRFISRRRMQRPACVAAFIRSRAEAAERFARLSLVLIASQILAVPAS